MATITPTRPTAEGSTITPVASTPAGDEVVFTGGDLIIEFENGAGTSITVEIAPTKTTVNVPGVGPVDVPTRSLPVAAGASGVILLEAAYASAYVNTARRIPLTYTAGDAALTVRAMTV